MIGKFVERLRKIPILLGKAPVRYSRTASEACLKAADEIEALRSVLAKCEEYFDSIADAGPTPNKEMELLVFVRVALGKLDDPVAEYQLSKSAAVVHESPNPKGVS